MVTETAPLRPISGSSPWRGLTGLTGAEARRWLPWRSLVLAAVGLGVLVLIFVIWRIAGAESDVNLRLGGLMYPFFSLWAIVLTLATATAAQGAVAGEVDEGTAAWLMGMPIGRPAFVVSKVLGAVPGVLAAVFGAGLVAYPVFGYASSIEIENFTTRNIGEVASQPIGADGFVDLPAVSEYLGVLVRMSLFLLVLVALMVLLGAIFRSTGVVLGLGVVLAVGLFMVGIIDLAGVVDVTPAGLISGLLDSVQAEPAPLAGPVFVSLLWILGLTGLAVARFQRRDL
jgi:hypothetical protein